MSNGLEERLVSLWSDIAYADPGLRLNDEQIDELYGIFAYALGILYGAGAVNDGAAINAICDLIEPYLTLILHGGPVCTCPKARYYTGRQIVTPIVNIQR